MARIRNAMPAGHRWSSASSTRCVERKAQVIPLSASQAIIRAADERVSSSGMWRLAPLARQDQISQTETSKPGPANSVIRSSGPHGNAT